MNNDSTNWRLKLLHTVENLMPILSLLSGIFLLIAKDSSLIDTAFRPFAYSFANWTTAASMLAICVSVVVIHVSGHWATDDWKNFWAGAMMMLMFVADILCLLTLNNLISSLTWHLTVAGIFRLAGAVFEFGAYLLLPDPDFS